MKTVILLTFMCVSLIGTALAGSPISPRVSPKIDQYGHISGINLRGEYVFGTNKIKSRIEKTFSSGRGLMFVLPGKSKFKLGTVFHKQTVEPYKTWHDFSAVGFLDTIKKEHKYPLATQFGMMQDDALKMMYQPTKKQALMEKIANKDKDSITARSAAVSLRMLKIETLNADDLASTKKKIRNAQKFNKNDYYFILDKVIWAKEIWYMYSPTVLKDMNSKAIFQKVAPKNPNIHFENGIGYVKQSFDDYKVVAMGASIIPDLTKAGNQRISNNLQIQLFDTLAFKSKETSNILK